MMRKKILYIKNYIYSTNLNYLENIFNFVDVHRICSSTLINKNLFELTNIIESYDIIIIGGGPQHLIGDYEKKYPEISNQIELVKIFSQKYTHELNSNKKVLLGICLGCQIIGLAFGCKISQSKEKIIRGFGNIDLSSINYAYLNDSNDIYLNKIKWDLFAYAYYAHMDYIDIGTNLKSESENDQNQNQNSEIICIGKSKTNINNPYIIAIKNSPIYAFQFHPEITYDDIKISQTNKSTYSNDYLEQLKLFEKYDSVIYEHFFSVFIFE